MKKLVKICKKTPRLSRNCKQALGWVPLVRPCGQTDRVDLVRPTRSNPHLTPLFPPSSRDSVVAATSPPARLAVSGHLWPRHGHQIDRLLTLSLLTEGIELSCSPPSLRNQTLELGFRDGAEARSFPCCAMSWSSSTCCSSPLPGPRDEAVRRGGFLGLQSDGVIVYNSGRFSWPSSDDSLTLLLLLRLSWAQLLNESKDWGKIPILWC
jgi:hypothetical protein